jgi:HAMP domain-containing protein
MDVSSRVRIWPADLPAELEAWRRRAAEADSTARVQRLQERIAIGRQKLEAARSSGRDTRPIAEKLGQLEGELRELQQRWEIPIFVLSLLEGLVDVAPWVPQGSQVVVSLPGVLDLVLDLDGVPF